MNSFMDVAPGMSPNPGFDAYAGPGLAALMNRGDVTDMYVNDDGFVWYESGKEGTVMVNIEPNEEMIRAIKTVFPRKVMDF